MAEPTAPPIELAPALVTPTPTPDPTAPPATPTAPAAEQPLPAGAGQPGTPPAAAVPPPAVPPVAPAVAPEVQQYIARLEEQNQRTQGQIQAQEELQILQAEVTAYAARLEEQEGFTPEQAQKIARQQGARAYQDFNALRDQQRSIEDALAIGQRYGVDPRHLINMPNRAVMLQAAMLATTATAAQSRLAALEAENAALKKKLAPAQAFATPGVAPTPASASYIEKLKSGGPLPSAAEIDKFTAQYLAGSR